MRITEVCVRFGAPGGAEQHVAAFSRELARLGHEVHVVTSDLFTEIPWRRGGPFEEPPKGVTVERLPVPRPDLPGRGLRMIGLRAALARSEPDVFHGHSHRYHHLRTMASVARRSRRPWCVTPHYHPIEAKEPAWKHAAAWAVDRFDARAVYAGAARVFTVTDVEQRLLRDLVPARAMATVPNGIDTARWSRPLDARAFRDATGVDREYVLYAGRLASNKGLGVLLDAWREVAPRHPHVDLVVAGRDWGVEGTLRAKAQALGLGDRVRFPGHLDDDAYASAMAGARLFVLPSEWEAFGIVLLEAMAAGRPCVATAVGGVPDVVQDGIDGLLVPHGDAGALARALDRVLADPALARRLGEAGRPKALAHDWAALARGLERHLLDAVAASRA